MTIHTVIIIFLMILYKSFAHILIQNYIENSMNNFCKTKTGNPRLLKKKKNSDVFPIKKQTSEVIIKIYSDHFPQKFIYFLLPKLTSFQEVKKEADKKISETFKCKNSVIGYQNVIQDYSSDYQLQMGTGFIEKDIELKCFMYQPKKSIQKYKLCICLAIGGFSKVFLVRSRVNGNFYAAKFIQKRENRVKSLLQNQKITSSSNNHPFLLKTIEFFQTQRFDILIMEYCPGGQLFYLLRINKILEQEQARFCFIEILLGLEELHNKSIMYRDLKPENILIDHEGHMKIADFGLTKSSKERSFSNCGSLQYMAPEIIGERGHLKYVDFYCLGALLYEMLLGRPPFYNENSTQEQTKMKILQQVPKFPPDIPLSREVKDIMMKLLNKNQKSRLGYFGGAKQIMTHPWVGKFNRLQYLNKSIKSPFKVDLSILNFDPDEIGVSQRAFQQRIQTDIKSLSKTKKSRSFTKTSLSRKYSDSQKYIKNMKCSSPLRATFQKNTVNQTKLKKNMKSPYDSILKFTKANPFNTNLTTMNQAYLKPIRKSYKLLKTQTNQAEDKGFTIMGNRKNSKCRFEGSTFTQHNQNKENFFKYQNQRKLFNLLKKVKGKQQS